MTIIKAFSAIPRNVREWSTFFRDATVALSTGQDVETAINTKAPKSAQFLVGASNGQLTAQRLVTNTSTVAWDLATAGQAKASLAYERTASETAAGITPSILSYEPTFFDPRRFGAVGNGVTDDTVALQKALDVAGVNGGTVKLPAGFTFLCTANLNVPVGIDTAVDIEGSSWTHGGIKFSGASVTTGLTFSGSSYAYCGEVRNLRIYCVSGAVRGITFDDLNHPRVTRCAIHGAAGEGVLFDTCLMGKLTHTLLVGCGSATKGSIEVDNCTTWFWDHSRISGGNTTVGGLLIDRTPSVSIIGGAIETCGIQIRIGSKTETTTGCTGGLIFGIDLENPGDNNHYIDFGAGLSSSARCNSWEVRGCAGLPSGTTTVTYAVKMNQCSGIEFSANNWSVPNGTSIYELTSTTNAGIVVRSHRNLFNASGIPWVRKNSAQVKAAGPYMDWNSEDVPRGLNPPTLANGSGATPSVLISATQGGYYRQMALFNGGATTVTALTGGERGMEIYVSTTNGNTTLTHSTSTADQFLCTGGVDLTMTANVSYHFVHNGTLWVQV